MNLENLPVEIEESVSLTNLMKNLVKESGLLILPHEYIVTNNPDFSTTSHGSNIDWIIISPGLVGKIMVKILPSFHTMTHKFQIIYVKEPVDRMTTNNIIIQEPEVCLQTWFPCPNDDCGSVFQSNELLENHTLTHPIFKCTVPNCNAFFYDGRKLNGHRICHKYYLASNKYKCNMPNCNFAAKYKCYVAKHKTSRHAKKSILVHCPYCGKPTKNRTVFLRHYKTMHMVEKQFSCALRKCSQKFRTLQISKTHFPC